jgi:hypothetical protein
MNRDVMITGGVKSVGTIEIYENDETTIMNGFGFPEFEGTYQSDNHFFWIKNTGNQQVEVYWKISTANPNNWEISLDTGNYVYKENSQNKYNFVISNQIGTDGNPATGLWNPDPNGNIVVLLGAGQKAKFAMTLSHNIAINTPGSFSFVLSFYAQSP